MPSITKTIAGLDLRMAFCVNRMSGGLGASVLAMDYIWVLVSP